MYYPYLKGKYEVAPGLLPFPRDFGNGEWDQTLFQIGDDFQTFRSQIETNREKERLDKYVCIADSAEAHALGTIALAALERLANEYPQFYSCEKCADGAFFKSTLTGDSFRVHPETNSVSEVKSKLSFTSAWDAMGTQVAADLAIWRLDDTGTEPREYLEALHLNAPNHWNPEEKVGQPFASVHSPVAHIETIVPWAINLLSGVLKKGAFTRFAWGVSTDCRLNHHPEPAPGADPIEWGGRRFDPSAPELYARVERQVLWGFPELGRAFFTIRTYFHDVTELKKTNPEAVQGLISGLESMSVRALSYKGLTHDKDKIIEWMSKPV